MWQSYQQITNTKKFVFIMRYRMKMRCYLPHKLIYFNNSATFFYFYHQLQKPPIINFTNGFECKRAYNRILSICLNQKFGIFYQITALHNIKTNRILLWNGILLQNIIVRMQQSHKDILPPMFDEKEGVLINGIQLNTLKGIGFNQQIVKTMACYVNQTKIAYMCGKNVIIYDTLTETQKSFERGKDQSVISTFNCFKTMYGEQYIIYATKAGKNIYPQVSVLNVWKNQIKSYVFYDLDVDSCISDVLLIGQGNRFVILSKEENTSRFIIFNLDETTPFYNQSLDLEVKGIFNLDSYSDEIYLFTSFEIYNLKYFKQNSLQKINLNLLPNEEIIDIKLANMSEYTFVIITNLGYVIIKRIISGLEVRQDLGTFETIEEGKVVTKRKVPSAVSVSEAFIMIGYHLCQQLTLIKINSHDFNKRSTENIKFCCPYLHKIVSLSFSEEFTSVCMVVQFKEQDKYGINMKVESQFLIKKGEEFISNNINNHSLKAGRIVPVVFNLVLYKTLLQTFRSPIQNLMNNLIFYKSIINISLVPYKKLILILSQDKKLRAMKFDVTSISLSKLFLWQHEFNDQPSAMDVHPSNFNLVLAFRQGIRIYTIGSEGILPNFYWNVKGCDVVKFSTYGHTLAVATASTIYLLNPYSTEQVFQFNVHLGSIRQMSFVDHDNYLYLQSQNGAINIYTLMGSRRLQYNNKAVKTIASAYDSKNDILIISSAEGTTKFYKQRGTVELGILWTIPSYITNILVINQFKCIILATSDGTIRIHQWPFLDIKQFSENYTEKILHDGPITNMKITHDMGYLISSCESSMYITKLQHLSQGLVTTQSEMINLVRSHNRDYLMLYHLDKLVLCSGVAQNLREERILQLDADKADNQDMSAQSVVKENQDHRKKLQQIQDQCNKLKFLKSQEFNNDINAVTIQRKKKQTAAKQKLIKHKEKLIEEEEETNQNMLRLYKEHDVLVQKIQELKNKQNDQIIKQKEMYEEKMRKETDQYLKKVSKLQGNLDKVKSTYEYSLKFNTQTVSQKDEENQILKEQIRATLDAQLTQAQQKGIDLRKKNNRLLAQNIRYNFRKKQLGIVMSEIEGEIQDLMVEKSEHHESLKSISKVLSHQDSMINHSEKKAKQYLKKNIIQTNKQQYLSHRTQQLQEKNNQLEIYLTQIEDKQKNMYEQFVKQSLTKKDAATKFSQSLDTSEKLKVSLKNLQTQKYQVKYSIQSITSTIVNLLKDYPEGIEVQYKKLFESKDKALMSLSQQGITNQKINIQTQKVGNLIINAQKKKKLNQTNDSIRKNILMRANHEAIELTSQCNQLRYEQVNLIQKLKILKIKLDQTKTSCQQRNSLSDLNINVSAIAQRNSKKQKLPFEVFQQENKMKRMYQLLAKDEMSEANIENKLILLKQLKKIQVQKCNKQVKCLGKSLTNESSAGDITKLHSQGNSIMLPSIHKKDFSLLLNSSTENFLVDCSQDNIFGRALSEEDR